MTTKLLHDALKRVESWPESAQEELATIALDIDAALSGVEYEASAEELAGIDRGLEAASEGRLVSSREVEALFTRHRPA